MSFLLATAPRPLMHVRMLSAAVLTLAALMGTHTEVRAMDESPDLKIELVGLPLSNTQRELQVRVTNVSTWWATDTKARVETVSPVAGNVLQMDVENLDPGQSVTFPYTLAAACNGQVVKAEVSIAKNYAGVPESNVRNNQIQSQACLAQAPQAQAKPTAEIKTQRPGTVLMMPTDNGLRQQPRAGEDLLAVDLGTPEQLRPGKDKVLIREPSAAAPVLARRESPTCITTAFTRAGLNVGFELNDSLLCHDNLVYQTLLSFDLSDFVPIYGTQKLLIGQATLSWTDPASPLDPSCVVNLSVPTEDWNQGTSGHFMATEDYSDEPTGPSQWDVLHGGLVSSWITDPVAARRGVMLRGPFEDLGTDEIGHCVTEISQPQLRMVYTVLP